MTDLLQRLRERSLLQRTLAYAAAAFALLQGILYGGDRLGSTAASRTLMLGASLIQSLLPSCLRHVT